MTKAGHSQLQRALESLLRRPVVLRAAWIMSAFSVLQLSASVVSGWLVDRSHEVRMELFVPALVSGVAVVVVSAASLSLLGRRDPDGASMISQIVLSSTSIGYGLFGVWIAFLFGFWASPFLLFPAVNALLVAILFGRRYALGAVSVSVAATLVLELLRFLGHVDYAPALVNDSIQGSGEVTWAFGTGGPLLVFVVLTIVLAFAMLGVVDHQREVLARSHDLIRTYVPSQVVDAVLEHGDTATRLKRRKITVFFSDVVGFTETTERMEPEELEIVLGEYFSEMARIAGAYNGTIDELVGDAVLIFFGAPTATNDRDHAERAIRMAVDMQGAVSRLNARWEEAGIDVVFRIRVGINTGVVAVGNVGSGARQKYAAIGRAVNLAARIQTHSRPGQILLSRATWLLVRDRISCTLHDTVDLKGITHPVELYAVDF